MALRYTEKAPTKPHVRVGAITVPANPTMAPAATLAFLMVAESAQVAKAWEQAWNRMTERPSAEQQERARTRQGDELILYTVAVTPKGHEATLDFYY
jgi:hypothetical protein